MLGPLLVVDVDFRLERVADLHRRDPFRGRGVRPALDQFLDMRIVPVDGLDDGQPRRCRRLFLGIVIEVIAEPVHGIGIDRIDFVTGPDEDRRRPIRLPEPRLHLAGLRAEEGEERGRVLADESGERIGGPAHREVDDGHLETVGEAETFVVAIPLLAESLDHRGEDTEPNHVQPPVESSREPFPTDKRQDNTKRAKSQPPSSKNRSFFAWSKRGGGVSEEHVPSHVNGRGMTIRPLKRLRDLGDLRIPQPTSVK
jgi:hypothetical protein